MAADRDAGHPEVVQQPAGPPRRRRASRAAPNPARATGLVPSSTYWASSSLPWATIPVAKASSSEVEQNRNGGSETACRSHADLVHLGQPDLDVVLRARQRQRSAGPHPADPRVQPDDLRRAPRRDRPDPRSASRCSSGSGMAWACTSRALPLDPLDEVAATAGPVVALVIAIAPPSGRFRRLLSDGTGCCAGLFTVVVPGRLVTIPAVAVPLSRPAGRCHQTPLTGRKKGCPRCAPSADMATCGGCRWPISGRSGRCATPTPWCDGRRVESR